MPEVQTLIGYLTGGEVTLLAFIIVAGSFRLWVYGYIDKAKDVQIERLTGLLEKAIENNRTLLDVMEVGRHGQA